MRFCSLKTYLSTFRQLISFHPTVFNFESVLGLFTTNYTFSFNTLASHVCLSWELPHPFSGITCQFRLGFCFLTHPYQSHHMVWYLPVVLGIWLGYFVPIYHWLCSLGFICPPLWIGCASLISTRLVNQYSVWYFRRREWYDPQAYNPCSPLGWFCRWFV